MPSQAHIHTHFTLTEDLDSKKYRKDDCWLLERVKIVQNAGIKNIIIFPEDRGLQRVK